MNQILKLREEIDLIIASWLQLMKITEARVKQVFFVKQGSK